MTHWHYQMLHMIRIPKKHLDNIDNANTLNRYIIVMPIVDVLDVC